MLSESNIQPTQLQEYEPLAKTKEEVTDERDAQTPDEENQSPQTNSKVTFVLCYRPMIAPVSIITP